MNNILQNIDSLIEETALGNIRNYGGKALGNIRNYGGKALGHAKKAIITPFSLAKTGVQKAHSKILSGATKFGELQRGASKLSPTAIGGQLRAAVNTGRGTRTPDVNLDLDKKVGRYAYGTGALLTGGGAAGALYYAHKRKNEKQDAGEWLQTSRNIIPHSKKFPTPSATPTDHTVRNLMLAGGVGGGLALGGKYAYDKNKQNQNVGP